MFDDLYTIFDFDGTLIDSMPLHRTAWIDVCSQHGSHTDQDEVGRIYDNDLSIGAMSGIVKVRRLIELGLLHDGSESELEVLLRHKEQRAEDFIYQTAQPLPGADAFLADLAAAEVPMALATTAPRNAGVPALRRLGWERYFADHTVFRDDVRNPTKPEPEYYQRAVQLLGGRTDAMVVVFEDSKPGFDGVQRTEGLGQQPYKLVAVTKNTALAQSYSPIVIIPDFTQFTVQKLREHLKGYRV